MPSRFRWTTFDLSDWLPPGWQRDVAAAAEAAEVRAFPRTPVISRESQEVRQVARGRVHAEQVSYHLPWLVKAYRNELLELATEVSIEPVSPHRTTATASSSTSSAGRACASSATLIPIR